MYKIMNYQLSIPLIFWILASILCARWSFFFYLSKCSTRYSSSSDSSPSKSFKSFYSLFVGERSKSSLFLLYMCFTGESCFELKMSLLLSELFMYLFPNASSECRFLSDDSCNPFILCFGYSSSDSFEWIIILASSTMLFKRSRGSMLCGYYKRFFCIFSRWILE